MILLLRKIRKSLLDGGKSSKYLKYAIGEIVLVVIGILIALQVNNINSNNQLENSAKQHVLILMEDLKEEQRALRSLDSALTKQLRSADKLSDHFKRKTPKTQELLGDIIELVMEHNFKTNPGGHDILVNTGEIALLTDKVQTLISAYRNQVKYIHEREFISNNFIQDKYEHHLFDRHAYLFHKGNPNSVVADFYVDDKRNPITIEKYDLRKDAKLEALVFGRRFQISRQLEAYKDGIRLNIALLTALKSKTD